MSFAINNKILIKEVQKFCEQKRLFIDVKKMVNEYTLKADLIRNKSKADFNLR